MAFRHRTCWSWFKGEPCTVTTDFVQGSTCSALFGLLDQPRAAGNYSSVLLNDDLLLTLLCVWHLVAPFKPSTDDACHKASMSGWRCC